MVNRQCPTGRVFQYRVGSGRVLEKIPGSGSGSGRVGVLKYMIGYFRVSFLLSGSSGYSWVFPGNSGYIGYFLFFWGVVSETLRFFSNNSQIICKSRSLSGKSSHVWEYPKHRVIPETSGLPEISGNTRYFGLPATR